MTAPDVSGSAPNVVPAEAHTFVVDGDWRDNSDGDGVLRFAWGQIEYGIPVSSGGKAGRTNPEELLLAAVAACYSITLALLYERKRLTVPTISMHGEAVMMRQPDHTLKITGIVLRPRIDARHVPEDKQPILRDIAHKADRYCVISNTLRGNVTITVEPQITVEAEIAAANRLPP